MLDDTQMQPRISRTCVSCRTSWCHRNTAATPSLAPVALMYLPRHCAWRRLIWHARRLPKSPFPTQSAPLLIENATVITMDANMPAADTMLVRDGRCLGGHEQRPAPGLTRQRRGFAAHRSSGKTVLPGFVELHMHLPPLAMLHASQCRPESFCDH